MVCVKHTQHVCGLKQTTSPMNLSKTPKEELEPSFGRFHHHLISFTNHPPQVALISYPSRLQHDVNFRATLWNHHWKKMKQTNARPFLVRHPIFTVNVIPAVCLKHERGNKFDFIVSERVHKYVARCHWQNERLSWAIKDVPVHP